GRLLAQLSEPRALFFCRRIDALLDQRDPVLRLGACLLERERTILAKSAPRRVLAAGIAGNQHERLDAVLTHADAHASHNVVHHFVALRLRLQRFEQPVRQCPLGHVPSGATSGHTMPAYLDVARCAGMYRKTGRNTIKIGLNPWFSCWPVRGCSSNSTDSRP